MDFKKTSVGSTYSDRNVEIEKRYNGDALLTITDTNDQEDLYAYLSAENAYALVDWITENVERPRVKTDVEIAFEKLEIGTVFGFYYTHQIPTRWPYKKVSETEYGRISVYGDDVVTGIPRDIKDAGSGTPPTARPVKPKLTVKDKIDALKIGARFVINGITLHHFIKTGESAFVRVGAGGGSVLYKDAFAPGYFARWISDVDTEVTEIH